MIHQWTQEEDQYLVENYLKMETVELMERLDVTVKQLRTRAKILSEQGRPIKQWKVNYTPEVDEYILTHFKTRSCFEIGFHLGIRDMNIQHRIIVLRREAKKRGDRKTLELLSKDKEDLQVSDMETITDGYDTVPWWMRQSTRCQSLAVDMYADRVKIENE